MWSISVHQEALVVSDKPRKIDFEDLAKMESRLPKPSHWTDPIREAVRGLSGVEVRTCFLSVPDEEQRSSVLDIVRDETSVMDFELHEIDCTEADEATFLGSWILREDEPSIRTYPTWWSDTPARIIIHNVDSLTGSAIPAIGAVMNSDNKRDRPCQWMFLFVLTPDETVPYSVVANIPSIKKQFDLREIGWTPGASISAEDKE